MFYKEGVLKNFPKFTGKHCGRVSFLIKLQASGLGPATLLKKRLSCRRFPVNFEKFPRTPFFTEHLWPTALVHLFLIQRYTSLFAFYKPYCFISKDFLYFIFQTGLCMHSFFSILLLIKLFCFWKLNVFHK